MNFSSVNFFILQNLYKTESKMNTIMEQLTTGKRINNAGDDPAGIGIVTRFKKDISGLRTSNQNIQSARSFLETADGAAGRANDILIQMKDLATQADNSTLSATDAANLQTQFDDLRTTYNDLVSNAKFNGKNLLNDGASAYTINTGFSSITVNPIDISSGGTGGVSDMSALDISTQTGAQGAIAALETNIEAVTQNQSKMGAKLNVLDVREEVNSDYIINMETARSRVEDADMALATSEMTKFQILQQSNLQLLQQYDMFRTSVLSLLQR